jgi:hypothetical protein
MKAARAMFAQLDAPQPQRAPILAGIWAALGARHLRVQAVAAGLTVLLFGGIGLASAAGERSPVPVPGFFRILSTSSNNTVELRGTIVRFDTNALILRTTTGDQTVEIDDLTEIRIGDVRGTTADLAPGRTVIVRASRVGVALRAVRITVGAAPGADDSTPPPNAAPGLDITASPSNDGGDDARTPVPAGSGDGNEEGATPELDGNSGDDDSSSPFRTPAGADDSDPHEDMTKTPSPGDNAEPTEHDSESHSPEPTEKPESTKQPEPTEKPEPTEQH